MGKERELLELLEKAVAESAENATGKCGLLLSGGVDSSLIGVMLKRAGVGFNCYITVFRDACGNDAADLRYAEIMAEKFGAELKVARPELAEVEEALRAVVGITGRKNIVQAGVGTALYFSLRAAAADGIKAVYTGMGADELFAGYAKFRGCRDVDAECKKALKKLYAEDLKRDIAIAKSAGVEIRAPYLDEKVVEFALSLPASAKIGDGKNKIVLRKLALDMGLPGQIALRGKKAAQYGSGMDRAIEKLAKKNGFSKKSEYLETVCGSIRKCG